MKKELMVVAGTGLGIVAGHTVGLMKGLFAGLDIAIEERQKAKKVQKILATGAIVAGAIATAAINENQKLREKLREELMSRQGQ